MRHPWPGLTQAEAISGGHVIEPPNRTSCGLPLALGYPWVPYVLPFQWVRSEGGSGPKHGFTAEEPPAQGRGEGWASPIHVYRSGSARPTQKTCPHESPCTGKYGLSLEFWNTQLSLFRTGHVVTFCIFVIEGRSRSETRSFLRAPTEIVTCGPKSDPPYITGA